MAKVRFYTFSVLLNLAFNSKLTAFKCHYEKFFTNALKRIK